LEFHEAHAQAGERAFSTDAAQVQEVWFRSGRRWLCMRALRITERTGEPPADARLDSTADDCTSQAVHAKMHRMRRCDELRERGRFSAGRRATVRQLLRTTRTCMSADTSLASSSTGRYLWMPRQISNLLLAFGPSRPIGALGLISPASREAHAGPSVLQHHTAASAPCLLTRRSPS